MSELTWKLFSQTGNVETYLLLKELENVEEQPLPESNEASEIDTELTGVTTE